jgi:hypothetical protein
MKRLVLICAFTLPMFGLTQPLASGNRVAVLRLSGDFAPGAEDTVARTIQASLVRELKARGFDAFDARMTYEEAERRAPDADYYVEVMSSRASRQSVGGIGVGILRVGLDVSVVIARVAAELRVYDARTLNVVDRYDLRQRQTAIIPTSVGVFGRFVWASVAIPFVQYGQYRAAANAVARDAADRIARR